MNRLDDYGEELLEKLNKFIEDFCEFKHSFDESI